MREDDGRISKSLYLASGRRPRFSLGCRPPTGSRISSPEVVTGMREAARSAELRAADGLFDVTLCGVLWPPQRLRAVGETSGRRRGRAGTAAAAPRAAPDGPPTDSEHAECCGVPIGME